MHRRLMLSVLVLLCASVADAAPKFIQHISPNAEILIPREDLKAGKPFYDEWRRGAGRFVELLVENEEVRKRVGKELDTAGFTCLIWTKMAELVLETRTVLTRRFDARGQPLPKWIQVAADRAREKRDSACSDKGDGGSANLGLQYLQALEKVSERESRRREMALADTEALSALTRLMDALLELAPAARGGLAPAGAGGVFVDPRVVENPLPQRLPRDGT